jgi:hypothetical protein
MAKNRLPVSVSLQCVDHGALAFGARLDVSVNDTD